ncbi:pseudouridine-5'-phosphatase-like isoform X2 [Maniola hyperantus]|nr:pseudouridine-5'-phosphatase-like isoform X2 [Maniola hyperantus]XP_034836059.1 pseudouridine-5'-phosphatase-like isoform X2 [Maniola hyperantus]
MGFEQIASRFGKKFTFELKCKIMGQHSREFAGNIIKELDLPLTVDEFLVETRKIFIELFPQSKVMPGVQRLLLHLHKHKIPMGLATSSSIETYDMKATRHVELFRLFPYKTYGSDPDVKRGKPSPDIFLVAAAKFAQKPAPENCLVFEDSLNGVRAAVAAGMQVVMVPDPRFERSLAPEATLIVNSMEDFRPEMFGLPPFDK